VVYRAFLIIYNVSSKLKLSIHLLYRPTILGAAIAANKATYGYDLFSFMAFRNGSRVSLTRKEQLLELLALEAPILFE